jgi:hypothetical protein
MICYRNEKSDICQLRKVAERHCLGKFRIVMRQRPWQRLLGELNWEAAPTQGVEHEMRIAPSDGVLHAGCSSPAPIKHSHQTWDVAELPLMPRSARRPSPREWPCGTWTWPRDHRDAAPSSTLALGSRSAKPRSPASLACSTRPGLRAAGPRAGRTLSGARILALCNTGGKFRSRCEHWRYFTTPGPQRRVYVP